MVPLRYLETPGKTKGRPRQKFTVTEDAFLRDLVNELGTNSWAEVALRLGTRSARQCRERFKNYLSPNLRNGQWTEEEDECLAAKVAEYGAKWSIIVGFFPSRSEVNLKNRWTLLSNRGGTNLEQEKRDVIQQLDSVIAGVSPAPTHAPEAIAWDDTDIWQCPYAFVSSEIDDEPFPE
jgi:hypothetical protein